jgi:hypothetical protein
MNALSPKARGKRPIAATPDASTATAPAESLLAVMTSWAFFAGFGFCFALSGLADGDLVVGLLGFAAFIAGFVAHLIINRIFGIGFTGPQVSLALAAFTVAVLCFIAGAIFNPAFGAVDIVIGLTGFGALTATFVGYVLITYGIRGSYAMLHRLHGEERRAP